MKRILRYNIFVLSTFADPFLIIRSTCLKILLNKILYESEYICLSGSTPHLPYITLE
jgi:hypothetical protein